MHSNNSFRLTKRLPELISVQWKLNTGQEARRNHRFKLSSALSEEEQILYRNS